MNSDRGCRQHHCPRRPGRHPTPVRASNDVALPRNIQAIEEIPIYARANGYLRRRLVDIGDRVRAGQLLAQIESPDLDQ
jgi:multidrug efflux pump subunit AcrA (membrane-fusion protein)